MMIITIAQPAVVEKFIFNSTKFVCKKALFKWPDGGPLYVGEVLSYCGGRFFCYKLPMKKVIIIRCDKNGKTLKLVVFVYFV